MSETVPEHLKYTSDHEWVADGDPVTVGITRNATAALGDLVYVELPEVGSRIEAGTVCGEIESTKSVSELYSPVTGTVVEINADAVDDPSIVNADPYGKGWLMRVDVDEPGELISAEQYRALTEA